MISRPTLDERVNSPAFTETTLSEVVEEAPRPGPITRMHPLTLRFDGELEEEFAEQYFRMTLTQVRVALILGIALYTVFGVLDTLIAPEQQRTLWMIRYAIVVPTWSVLFVFTYRPAFRQYREPAVSAAVVIAALGIVAMLAVIPSPGNYLYYAGLVLVIVYTFTLVRLRLPFSLGISAIIIASYLAVAISISATPGAVIVNNMF